MRSLAPGSLLGDDQLRVRIQQHPLDRDTLVLPVRSYAVAVQLDLAGVRHGRAEKRAQRGREVLPVEQIARRQALEEDRSLGRAETREMEQANRAARPRSLAGADRRAERTIRLERGRGCVRRKEVGHTEIESPATGTDRRIPGPEGGRSVMSAIPEHWQVVASGRGGGGPAVHNPRDWRPVDPARGLRRSVGGSPYLRRVQTKVVPVTAWSHNNSQRGTSGN